MKEGVPDGERWLIVGKVGRACGTPATPRRVDTALQGMAIESKI